jgi:hypothetical protein
MKKILVIALFIILLSLTFLLINSIKIPSPTKLNQHNIPIERFI